MKNKSKMLILGASTIIAAIIGTAALSNIMTQDVGYDKMVTQPIEHVQHFLGVHDPIKEKFQKFVENDKQFLLKMNVPKEIVDVPIILKTNNTTDKMLYPLMKFGQTVFNWTDDMKTESQLKYEGKTSSYSLIQRNDGRVLNEYLMLGVTNLEAKEHSTYKSLYKIFDNNEEKMSSFVFFHEMGHKISSSMTYEDVNIEKIISTFEKEKNIKLSKEDKQIINSQYSETFSDSFAISMMKIKYPELDIEKTKIMIAGLRLNDGESSHLSSPGIVASDSLSSKSDIKQVLDIASKSALITTQFYSNIDFSILDSNKEQAEGRSNSVNIIAIDQNSVKQRIDDARKKFLSLNNTNNQEFKL